MRRSACTPGFPAALAAALACNSSGAPASTSFGTTPLTLGPADESSGPGSTTGGSTSSVPEDSTAGAASTAEVGDTTPVLDVGVPDVGSPDPEGCRGKIDFLFVISRHKNMQGIQQRLIEALPDFVDAIEAKFADFDYQIMVVDDDPYWGQQYCNESCADENCTVPDYPCDAVDDLTTCEFTLGAGTIFNAGDYTFNKPCPVAGGKRYLVKGQPDLHQTFQCIAQVGTNGGYVLAQALVDAVTPAKTAHCNNGFLRDDALLFVSLISFATDGASPGTPEEWAQAVIDAKHGDPDAVVMFSIGPMSGVGWWSFEDCVNGWSGRICRMMEFFPYRMLRDEDSPDYGVLFDDAVELVDEACSAFVPQ